MDSEQTTTKRRVWLRRAGTFLFALALAWFFGDLGYYLYVSQRIDHWESEVSRNDEGVMRGCEAFERGNGSTAILFVHGINDTPRIWRKMLPKTADQGYTCRAIRLPGFGESIDRYASFGRADWVECVANEIDRLASTHDRVFIVAHSLGGAVALNYLRDSENDIDGIILIAPAIGVANHRSPVLSTRAWHQVGNAILIFTDTTMSPFGLDVVDPAEQSDEYRIPFTPRRTIDDTFALIDENRSLESELQTPLCLIISEDDQVIDADAAIEFFEEVPCRPKSIHRTDNSGHAIPVDHDWETVTDFMLEFVRTVERLPSDAAVQD